MAGGGRQAVEDPAWVINMSAGCGAGAMRGGPASSCTVVYRWPPVCGPGQCGVAVDISIGLALVKYEKEVWRKLFELALAMVIPLSSAAASGKEAVCLFCRLHCHFQHLH